MDNLKKSSRKIMVAAVGVPVIITGVILLVLPGPGLLLIAAGLAILALEFEWAEKRLVYFKNKFKAAIEKSRPKK